MIRSFGKLPRGRRLERIHKSVFYREGKFHNLHETPLLAADASYPRMLIDFFKKIDGREPVQALPSVKTDLSTIPSTYPVIIWLGHSSYFMKIDGRTILVDPVFSSRPSPVSFLGKDRYQVTNPYHAEDFPELDLVIITHDHYDHLDYATINKLKSKTSKFCTALGVGEHLEAWGVEEDKIIELDWWERTNLAYGLDIIATPARHFSGRLFKRNQSLWCSFVLKSSKHQFFIGGDSGYDDSFKTIGEQFGGFDIAMLDCGQYNEKWPLVHMNPEETIQASLDLKAKVLLPVHWGQFTLALHPWKEPIERIVRSATLLEVEITTPRIGEIITLDHPLPKEKWWES